MNITKLFVGLTSRRSMLRGGLVGPGLMGAALLAGMPATSLARDFRDGDELTEGDVAILRFLAALEILEADLWEQYNELGGIRDSELTSGTGIKTYTDALNSIDNDMSHDIHDNTDDEFSHASFLNAYLHSKNASQVSLEKFRMLDGSQATGSSRKKRLTNLMRLTVDTSWWTRYRSSTLNPDLGDVFSPAVPSLATGEHTAIPRTDADLQPQSRLQAIANTAASISEPSNRVAAACIRRWRSASATSRCCASSWPSDRRRPCISRFGTTRPAISGRRLLRSPA